MKYTDEAIAFDGMNHDDINAWIGVEKDEPQALSGNLNAILLSPDETFSESYEMVYPGNVLVRAPGGRVAVLSASRPVANFIGRGTPRVVPKTGEQSEEGETDLSPEEFVEKLKADLDEAWAPVRDAFRKAFPPRD